MATGGSVQVLAPEQAHYVAVSFTPDGNYVMFVRSDRATQNFRYLYQMPVLGGTPKQLYRDVDSAPTFSPDSQEIAYTRGIIDSLENSILIAKADGSGERQVMRRKSFSVGSMPVSWSPDGQNLAAVSPETNGNESRWVVLVLPAIGGGPRELYASRVPLGALAWLPDGSGLLMVVTDQQSRRGQIHFLSYPKGEVTRVTNDLANYDGCCLQVTRDANSLVALQNALLSDIWVGKADGSEANQVTSGEPLGLGLNWAGNKLLAGAQHGQWWLMDPDGNNKVLLTSERDLRFQMGVCSDKHLVYTTWRDGSFSVWSSDVDGSNARELVPKLAGILGGGCSADGQTVFYATEGGVWAVPVGGGTPAKTDLPLAELGFASDGKLIFIRQQRLENGIVSSKLIVSSFSAPSVALHTYDTPYGMQSPKWTPDSKALAYILNRMGAGNIWIQRLSGGEPVQLTNFTSGEIFDYSWSKDGKQLAISRGRRKSDVVMMSNFR